MMSFSSFRLVLLTTDVLVFLLLAGGIGFLLYARRREYYRTAWRQIRSRRLPMICMGVVLAYASVALTDSVHFRQRMYTEDGKPDANVISDRLGWRVSARERDEAWRQVSGETGASATDQTKEG